MAAEEKAPQLIYCEAHCHTKVLFDEFYSLEYPDYWTVMDLDNCYLISDQDKCGAILGVVFPLFDAVTLDKFIASSMEYLGTFLELDRIEEIKSHDGQTYRTYVMNEKEDGEIIRIHRVGFCSSGDRVVIMDTFAETESFEKYDSYLKKMISSFHFKELSFSSEG